MPTKSSKSAEPATISAKRTSDAVAKAVGGRPAARKSKVPPKPLAKANTGARRAASSGNADAGPKPKTKLVRDSFTMPKADFDLIDELKERALAFKRPAKKSELLRAGLHALIALDNGPLRAALDSLVPLKAGRPKKVE